MPAVIPAEVAALAQSWVGNLDLDPEVNTRRDGTAADVDQEVAGARLKVELGTLAKAGDLQAVAFQAPLTTLWKAGKPTTRFPTYGEVLEQALELSGAPGVPELLALVVNVARDGHPAARALLGRVHRAAVDQAVGKFESGAAA